MTASIFLNLGLLLVTGLLFSLLAARFNLPRIAFYVLAGLLWSPDLLGGLFKSAIGQLDSGVDRHRTGADCLSHRRFNDHKPIEEAG